MNHNFTRPITNTEPYVHINNNTKHIYPRVYRETTISLTINNSTKAPEMVSTKQVTLWLSHYNKQQLSDKEAQSTKQLTKQ